MHQPSGVLNEKLWNAAAKVYPAVPLSDEARFLPLLELDKGEISSTAAIEIARATRQNAQAIAERLGINIVGRHTALGDAMVTGEVFLKMIPLLEEKGLYTLRDVQEAAKKTYYARVKY